MPATTVARPDEKQSICSQEHKIAPSSNVDAAVKEIERAQPEIDVLDKWWKDHTYI